MTPDRPLRVMQVITRGDQVGGAQLHVRELSEGLSARGIDVTVAMGSTGWLDQQLEQRGIRTRLLPGLSRSLGPSGDFKAALALIRLIRRVQPDVLALHSTKAGLIGRVAGRIANVPTVFTAHGLSYTPGHPMWRRGLSWLCEIAVRPCGAWLIPVSDFDQRLAVRGRICAVQKINRIHNGLPDVQQRKSRPELSRPTKVITVCRLAPPKEPVRLLEAIARISHANWHLSIVGDGPLRAEVEQSISRLGIAENVDLLGERSDVDDLLARSDVFVLTSRFEGLPLAVIEAMRTGLAIIATDVGGVSELIQHGRSGLLVESQSTDDLEKALCTLISEPNLRSSLAAAARERFEQLFTLERCIDQTVAVYNALARTVRIDPPAPVGRRRTT